MLFCLFVSLFSAATTTERGPITGITWEPVRAPAVREADAVFCSHPFCDGRMLAGGPHGGIWRTDDYGAVWSPSDTPVHVPIQTFLFHPLKPGCVLAGTRKGVFASTDGGRTWQERRSGFPPPRRNRFTAPVAALAWDPASEDHVLAGFGTTGDRTVALNLGSLYRSKDWGKTWELVDFGYGDIRGIAFSPSPSHMRYVVLASDAGVFVSPDRGGAWRRADSSLPLIGGKSVETISYPVDAFLVTMANGSRFFSTDNGGTWQACGEKFLEKVRSGAIREKQRKGMPQADGAEPRQDESGFSLRARGSGLSFHKGRDMAFSPFSPRRYVLCGEKGAWLTSDGGAAWRKCGNGLAPGSALDAVVRFNRWTPARLYLWSQQMQTETQRRVVQLFTTSDGGRYWRPLCEVPGAFLHDLLPGSTTPRVLIALSDRTVLRSVNHGEGWRRVLFLPPSGGGGKLSVDPQNPRIMYVTWNGREGGLWKSADDGRSWRRVFPVLPHVSGKAAVTGRGELIVCGGRSVWRWDRSQWTQLLSRPIAARDVAIVQGRIVWAVFAPAGAMPFIGPGEIWYSPDYGRKWYPFRAKTAGPPPSAIASFSSEELHLLLATDGGGFFRLSRDK